MFRLLGRLTGELIETGIVSQILYFSLRKKSGSKRAAIISAIITLLILTVFGVINSDLLATLAYGIPLVLIWFVLDLIFFKPKEKQNIDIEDETNDGEINEDALNRYLKSKSNIEK